MWMYTRHTTRASFLQLLPCYRWEPVDAVACNGDGDDDCFVGTLDIILSKMKGMNQHHAIESFHLRLVDGKNDDE